MAGQSQCVANSEKKRLPKACTACRISKVKCEGDKPCLRCRNAGVECQFFQQPGDPTLEKLNDVAKNLGFLSDRFDAVQQSVADIMPVVDSMKTHVQKHDNIPGDAQENAANGHLVSLNGSIAFSTPREAYRQQLTPYEASQLNSSYNDSPSQSFCDPFIQNDVPEGNIDFSSTRKRKRSDFEVCENTLPVDVVTRGLISVDEALQYFHAFFDGCDKFVPVFDPKYDTFDSVRERSSMLFDIICTVGCRTEHGTASRQFQFLNKELNSKVCDVVFRDAPRSIETIQALLIVASYSEKGFLLTSVAMRMALNLGLPKLYKELIEQTLDADNLPSLKANSSAAESEDNSGRLLLFRSVRIFLGTFVLDHIFSLDTGKAPSVQGRHAMRRCRVLAKHPLRTSVDLRLLAQVELNAIRAQIHKNLAEAASLSDQHLSDIIQDARIDLRIWFHDWLNIIETSTMHGDEKPVLLINLQIQRDWGEMMMLCKALQATGIENIAAMSEEQSSIINLLKESAQRHLKTIISSPDHYLAKFKYSMDFVWAKCAFSVLLLLKLARILPGTTNMSQFLLDAKILISELSKANGSSNIYFRILSLSVEKCERAWQAHLDQSNIGLTSEAVPTFQEDQDAEIDFQLYVPKEFVFEWDFPGLTFCYIPFDFQDMFLDFDTDFVSF